MSFTYVNISPTEQEELNIIIGKIIKTLGKCNPKFLKSVAAKAAGRRWFGDDSDTWMNDLAGKLNKFRTGINLHKFELTYATIGNRVFGQYGVAFPPGGVWLDRTSVTESIAITFKMKLDFAWSSLPSAPKMHQPKVFSKYHGFIHELTHLILNTDDVNPPYGYDNCTHRANTSAAQAKDNADNWAFFMDEISFIDGIEMIENTSANVGTVTHSTWMRKTNKLFGRRSTLLKEFNKQLKIYERRHNNPHLLDTSWHAWYRSADTKIVRERGNRMSSDLEKRMLTYLRSCHINPE